MLCQSLPKVTYFDCELPRQAKPMEEDPEGFLEKNRGRRLVLDEIHQLNDPSRLLKIAADHFPDIRIIATGSSTLAASKKFRDTLTGRKTTIRFTPMCSLDLEDFGGKDLPFRFLRGGLPPFFLSSDLPEKRYHEWVEDYWARDVQELYNVDKRSTFRKFLELLMVQSGGIYEATRFSRACEVARNTIAGYLNILEETFVVRVVRPFSAHKPTEIVSAPKVYGFDTGFVCFFKGWRELRAEDMGLMWEHYVLNEMTARLQTGTVRYWRDKQGHELDFVLVPRGGKPVVVECKWRSGDFSEESFRAFFRIHEPQACYVVCSDVGPSYRKKIGNNEIRFVGLSELIGLLESLPL